MARHRSHSIAFKRQIAQEFIAGETLHGLAKRHDLSRNLIRAALERLVGKHALELEFLNGALRSAPRLRSAPTSVIAGPAACVSPKDAG
jgi:transposase-like protein